MLFANSMCVKKKFADFLKKQNLQFYVSLDIDESRFKRHAKKHANGKYSNALKAKVLDIYQAKQMKQERWDNTN